MTTRFIELAGEINSAMPEYVIHRLAQALNDSSKPLAAAGWLCLAWLTRKTLTTRARALPSSSWNCFSPPGRS